MDNFKLVNTYPDGSEVYVKIKPNKKPKEKDKYITADDQIRLQKLILSVARETFPEFSTGGGKPFYSMEEWKSRGEVYGKDAKLIVTYDGGDLRPFFTFDYGWELMEKMRVALDKAGYWVEQCNCWSSAIYKHD